MGDVCGHAECGLGHSDSIYVPHVLMLSWTPEPHYQFQHLLAENEWFREKFRCYHLQFASIRCLKYCNNQNMNG
jgi:hypothetical protein